MTAREALRWLHERCEEFERKPYPKIYGLDHAIGDNVESCEACGAYAESALDHESPAMRLLSDLASRECETPGKCGDVLPYCLTCRARAEVAS